MLETKHIPEELKLQIIQAADGKLADLAADFRQWKRSGKDLATDCPSCGAQKKLTISPTKDIYKCFVCDTKGKGAIDYLIKVEGKTFPESLIYVAERYNVDLTVKTRAYDNTKKKTFRDEQLLTSGIPNDAQKWIEILSNGTTKKERNRYESGTLEAGRVIKAGDDMILNYLALDGKPMFYKDKSGREREVVRVRYQNPALHLSKDGEPMKYQSPYGSGSHLWLPNTILEYYRLAKPIGTLYLTEGEKKADKMSLHQLPAVGLMGINNLNYESMTSTFEQLIKRCEVKRVVFVLDSDWNDIGKNSMHADQRPRAFFSAVKKFKEYFYAYKNVGLELDIFFAHGKDKVHKGIDDLLVYELKNKEQELKEDFEQAFIDREGKGSWINVHKITLLTDYKLLEFFHLQDTQAFLKAHEEELKKKREFKIGKYGYTWNTESSKFEMIEKILDDEKYWTVQLNETRTGKEIKNHNFNYQGCFTFLRNRGFGLFNLDPFKPKERYRIIKREGKIVSEVNPLFIRHYLIDFTKEIKENEVLEMLYRGGKQYIGPESLSNMEFVQPEFIEPEKECQYLFFQKTFWKITADGIKEGMLEELPKHIWSDKIIDFDAKFKGKPLLNVTRNNDDTGWKIAESVDAQKSDMYKFIVATSNFWWHKQYELSTTTEGVKSWTKRAQPEKLTDEENRQLVAHIVCKMIAAGYILHEYRNRAQMKAVVAMDGVESEVGKSQGGSGKSIYATMFEHILPTEIVDGKKPRLTEDPHIYENVDERTAIIVFDDCRVNLDFEFFFSQITRGIDVNPKGLKRFKIEAPKFIFSTNHAVGGDGNSFARRQYLLAFSDFFNGYRTPQDYFGRLLFTEWDYEQWNLFYNLMATAIQIYLKFNDLNRYTIPGADLERRKLRQRIGENFIDFAELYFGEPDPNTSTYDITEGGYRNYEISKDRIVNDYLQKFPLDKKFINARTIKDKVKLYCQYKGLDFNPQAGDDGRIKRNGKEYLCVADENFNRNSSKKLE